MKTQFPLSTAELELLAAFLKGENVQGVAQILAKDPTIVSRQVQAIQARHPLFEKRENKWRLNERGVALAGLAKAQATDLNRQLEKKNLLTIATTPEFASRVLPGFFRKKRDSFSYEVIVSHNSIERILLRGQADLGIECGRPESPAIRFQQIAPESVVVAYPHAWGALKLPEIMARPYMEFLRIPAHDVFRSTENMGEITLRSNSIGFLRAMVVEGKGWTVLPLYPLQEEIKQASVRVLELDHSQGEKFGLWWSIHRPLPKDVLQEFSAYLKSVRLL